MPFKKLFSPNYQHAAQDGGGGGRRRQLRLRLGLQVCESLAEWPRAKHNGLMQVHFLFVDGRTHQIELDPLMLTILGVVAGVLIVIIIVTLAIRIHASR